MNDIYLIGTCDVIVDVEEKHRHSYEDDSGTGRTIGTEDGVREFFVTERVTKSDEEEYEEGNNDEVVKTS